MSDLVIRAAKAEEAGTLAALYFSASGGIGDYLWGRAAREGEAALDAAARRYARDAGQISFRQCRVAVQAGRILGMVHLYPDGPWEEGLAMGLNERDAVFAALNGLEAPDAFYVNALAVEPEARGQGLGRRLLSVAADTARTAGFPALDLIVFSDNPRAERLYAREGFVVADRAPLPALLNHPPREARLMVKWL